MIGDRADDANHDHGKVEYVPVAAQVGARVEEEAVCQYLHDALEREYCEEEVFEEVLCVCVCCCYYYSI